MSTVTTDRIIFEAGQKVPGPLADMIQGGEPNIVHIKAHAPCRVNLANPGVFGLTLGSFQMRAGEERVLTGVTHEETTDIYISDPTGVVLGPVFEVPPLGR